MITEKFKELSQHMSDHTANECGSPDCRPYKRGGCCTQFDCEMAASIAAGMGENVRPLSISNDEVRFFSADQPCVLKPWQRPVCTWHTCKINALGFKPGDVEWTTRYFRLREAMNEEMENCMDTAFEIKYVGEL